MQAKDVTAACRILNDIIRTGSTTAMETPLSEAEFQTCYLKGDDLIACHVAVASDGSVTGFQWIGRHAKLPRTCADIATFTDQSAVQRGAGRALFAASSEVARLKGYRTINATIRADNVPGLGYYSKMGFVDHSVAQDVPLSSGELVDRITKRFLV